ncbi:MAG: hypothetical protein KAR79_01110, partial [Simkaniaceae bacterium]|nr:hypothetical protein [Simkaniaceae bacterium]
MLALNDGVQSAEALRYVLELEESYTSQKSPALMLNPQILALVCKPWKKEISGYIIDQLTLIYPPLANNPTNHDELEIAKQLFLSAVKTYRLIESEGKNLLFGSLPTLSTRRFNNFSKAIEQKRLIDTETMLYYLNRKGSSKFEIESFPQTEIKIERLESGIITLNKCFLQMRDRKAIQWSHTEFENHEKLVFCPNLSPLKKLPGLRIFSMHGHLFPTLPEGIEKVTQLLSLSLENNQISELPTQIVSELT